MKRFVDFISRNLTGGAPFTNDSFRQVQQQQYLAMSNMVASLLKTLNPAALDDDNGVLFGVEYSGTAGNYALSAGVVKLGSDLYVFPGASGLSANGFIRAASPTPTEDFIYQDGVSKPFFETLTAEYIAGAGAGVFVPVNFNNQGVTFRLRKSQQDLIGILSPGSIVWNDLTLLNDWGGSGIQYARDFAGNVHIRFLSLNGGNATSTFIAQLPAGFRPPQFTVIALRNRDTSTATILEQDAFNIQPDGAIVVRAVAPFDRYDSYHFVFRTEPT